MDPTRRSEILALAARSAALEPDVALRSQWQAAADAAVNHFIDALPTARAAHARDAAAAAHWAEAVPASGDFGDLVESVVRGLGESGLTTASPGHLAFVPGGGLYVGAVSDHIAAAVNAFSADAYASPVAVQIHAEALRWLADVVGYGDAAWGDITSGGSQATLTAFYVAREARGLRPRDYHRSCVYLSEHTHHCVEKALKLLFSGDIVMRKVPLHDHAMDATALARLVAEDRAAGLTPWMVVATAGSTNLGRVDPLAALGAVARSEGLWLHVDGAYGGMFKLCGSVRYLLDGMAEADSVVLDPHKGLFLPYGCGVVLFKQGEQLRRSLAHTGSYLQDREASAQRSPLDYSLELTRPFRSLRIWLALKVHGEAMLADALQEKLLLAAHAREQLQAIPGLVMVGPLDLSIFAFRHASEGAGNETGSEAGTDPDASTRRLLEAINAQGEVFLSSTTIEGRFVIRVAVLSFRTHLPTIDALVERVRTEVARMVAA